MNNSRMIRNAVMVCNDVMGHKIGEWHHTEQNAYAQCEICEKMVYISLMPIINDKHMGGRALSEYCEEVEE